jgi:cytochrome P450
MELFTTKRLESFRPPRTDEFNQMIKSIMDDVEQGKIVDLAMKLSHVAMNNITRMLLNKRFYGVDASAQQEAYKFKELTFNVFKLAVTRSIGDFVPWLKWVIIVSGLKSHMMKVKARADVVLQEFLELKKNGKIINMKNDDVDYEDFVDVLMAQPTEDGTGHLSDNSIKAVIQDMLLAGTDTSGSTVEWAIAELLRHPHCAKKLQTELDEVVGKDRIVTESDIPNLPYLNAVVNEVLRLHPAVPLAVPHVALEDTIVGGFDFVAGTRLFVNIYAIHRDPKWWERPLEFDPERFIKNPKINPLGSHFQFIPFGAGRRQCPGLLLGLLFVQVGLARLMQSFDFALPTGQDPATLDMTEKFGITIHRQNPLQVVCKPRMPKQFYKGN